MSAPAHTHTLAREYGAPDAPLGAYAGLITAFMGAGAAALVVGVRRDALPERFALSDVALASVATHHLARLITKDRVTSVLRAPFTRYSGDGAPGEVREQPRSRGSQLAIGQLLTCPYCVGDWVALGVMTGMVAAPRATRACATVLTVAAVADALQALYVRLSPAS